jgi:hypothetical protein
MMAILARNRRGKAQDVASLRAARDHFERRGRNMVALIDDQVAIATDEIRDLAFAHEALYQGDVDVSGWLAAASADRSNLA